MMATHQIAAAATCVVTGCLGSSAAASCPSTPPSLPDGRSRPGADIDRRQAEGQDSVGAHTWGSRTSHRYNNCISILPRSDLSELRLHPNSSSK